MFVNRWHGSGYGIRDTRFWIRDTGYGIRGSGLSGLSVLPLFAQGRVMVTVLPVVSTTYTRNRIVPRAHGPSKPSRRGQRVTAPQRQRRRDLGRLVDVGLRPDRDHVDPGILDADSQVGRFATHDSDPARIVPHRYPKYNPLNRIRQRARNWSRDNYISSPITTRKPQG